MPSWPDIVGAAPVAAQSGQTRWSVPAAGPRLKPGAKDHEAPPGLGRAREGTGPGEGTGPSPTIPDIPIPALVRTPIPDFQFLAYGSRWATG